MSTLAPRQVREATKLCRGHIDSKNNARDARHTLTKQFIYRWVHRQASRRGQAASVRGWTNIVGGTHLQRAIVLPQVCQCQAQVHNGGPVVANDMRKEVCGRLPSAAARKVACDGPQNRGVLRRLRFALEATREQVAHDLHT